MNVQLATINTLTKALLRHSVEPAIVLAKHAITVVAVKIVWNVIQEVWGLPFSRYCILFQIMLSLELVKMKTCNTKTF